MTTPVSVIVRSKDRAHTIERALQSIGIQTHPAEIVVVDSGSTDGTVEIARRYADRIIEIAPEEFTYGGALNTGAEAASGEVHIALSAHCSLPDAGWIERLVAHYSDPAVAGVCGNRFGPDGRRLTQPLRRGPTTEPDPNPYWGYTNHAGSWRAEVRARLPFSTELIACEDNDWERRVRAAGLSMVFDPSLAIAASHRRREGWRALYRRAHREGEAIQLITGKRPATIGDVLSEWTTLQERSKLIQLTNPYRAVDIIGRYRGERRGAKRSAGAAGSTLAGR